MSEQQAFRLLDLRIEPDTGQITGAGRSLRLEPKPMAVLLTLLRTPGEVVTRQQLLDSVWAGVVVGDEAVTRCISELRDALGDNRQTPRFIRTLPKRGYVLLATPEPLGASGRAEPYAPAPSEEAAAPQAAIVPTIDTARPTDGSQPPDASQTSDASQPTNASQAPDSSPPPARSPAPDLVPLQHIATPPPPAHAGTSMPDVPTRPAGTAWLAFALTLLCVLAVLGWRFGPGAPAGDVRSTAGRTIAVLPFLEQGAASSYFGDGLAEQIVNALVQVPELEVSATGIAFALAHAQGSAAPDAAALGRQMHVDVVLAGSIQRVRQRVRQHQHDRLRVNVQLIDSRTGTQLWSARYDREATDVFELQDDIANRVAQALRIELATPLRVARISQDLGAYDLYLLGRWYWNLRTVNGLQRSNALFQQAVAADPNNALAYSGLADSYLLLAGQGAGDRPRYRTLARAAVRRALALAPELAEAQASLGLLHYELGEWRQADIALRKATMLNPRYAMAWMWLAISSSRDGRLQEAYQQASVAVRLEPSHPTARVNLMTAAGALGRIDEARRHARELERLQPQHVGFAILTFVNARDTGDVAEMARIARRVRALPAAHGIGETLEARLDDYLHRDAAARDWLRRADARASTDTQLEIDLAWLDVMAFGGDVDGVRRRIDGIPDGRIELAGGAPTLSGFLGVALARAGRFAEALPPLLDALAGNVAKTDAAMFNLTNYGFALRACRAAPDPRCPALRAEALAYLQQMQSAGRRGAGFLAEAGLLHAADGDAASALPLLRAATAVAACDARTFTDDVRLAPVRNDPRVVAFLAQLPADDHARSAVDESRG